MECKISTAFMVKAHQGMLVFYSFPPFQLSGLVCIALWWLSFGLNMVCRTAATATAAPWNDLSGLRAAKSLV
jgi:hypothetical protein